METVTGSSEYADVGVSAESAEKAKTECVEGRPPLGEAPTESPTAAPTAAPSAAPTAAPTPAPTPAPSPAPTEAPPGAPTEASPVAPTEAPPVAPTEAPPVPPTEAPPETPTEAPIEAPTEASTTTKPKVVEELMLYEAIAGVTELTVADVTGLSAGMDIEIADGTNSETHKIVKVTAERRLFGNLRRLAPGVVTIDEPLQFSYPAGSTVKEWVPEVKRTYDLFGYYEVEVPDWVPDEVFGVKVLEVPAYYYAGGLGGLILLFCCCCICCCCCDSGGKKSRGNAKAVEPEPAAPVAAPKQAGPGEEVSPLLSKEYSEASTPSRPPAPQPEEDWIAKLLKCCSRRA